jgi:hypothetical protein
MILQKTIALNNQERKQVCCSLFDQFHQEYRKILDIKPILLFASTMAMIFVISGSTYPFQFNSVNAETGSGTDIFRVIVTIMGADKDSTGDVVPLVTVNEHSRLKLINVGDSSTADASGSTNENKIIEYVATFPNVTVKAGDEYKTCVLPLKTLKLICAEGTNSPGKRPEIVDVNLNSTTPNSQALTVSGKHMSIPYSSQDDQTGTQKNERDSKDDKVEKDNK